MNIVGVLQQLAKNNVELRLSDAGKLKVLAPKGAMTQAQQVFLKSHKEQVLSTFARFDIQSNRQLELLSFAQQRLWLLEQISPGSIQYNIATSLLLTGQLNVGALQHALNTIVARHQVLRTVYCTDEQGEVFQIIRPQSPVVLSVEDLTEHASTPIQSQQRLAQLITHHGAQPFDLAHDLMLRVQLVKISDNQHQLLINMHHIAADGWSLALMVDELSQLYSAYAKGEPNPLADLPLQYSDYAHWQREHLQGAELARQLSYWKSRLTGVPAVHSLGLDSPRPPLTQFQGDEVRQQLPVELQQRLNALASGQGASLFMLLNAAFACLLGRYSKENDIIIGSPIANRKQSEVASLVGFFVNTLVLRTDLSADPTISSLLEQSKQSLLEAYDHQQVPFEKLVDELNVERSLSHNPLFQVMLVLQNNAPRDFALSGLTLIEQQNPSGLAKFDLTLSITEAKAEGDGLTLQWEYSTALFKRETIERLSGYFAVMLAAIVDNPELRVSELPMLTEQNSHQLLHDWNDTACAYPQHLCIHQLFETQAQKTPQAIALAMGQQQLSYAELDAKANQLAHYLVAQGVKPQTMVPVCVERSFEMIIAVMAVLKAGAAYVPIEVDMPQARIVSILVQLRRKNESNLVVLISGTKLDQFKIIQWQQAELIDQLVVVDDAAAKQRQLAPDLGSVADLFDYIAESATDEVSAGGFSSIYSGEAFTLAQVEFYQQWVVALVKPYLTVAAHITEIGCGSGLMSLALAQHCASYIAIDPSPATVAANQARPEGQGIDWRVGFAHDDLAIAAGSQDVILLASVVQFFPGYQYLDQVMAALLHWLKPGGVIILADLPATETKALLRSDIQAYIEAQPSEGGKVNLQYQQNLDNLFYLDNGYFDELPQRSAFIDRIDNLKRETQGQNSFDNELRFRFDVVIHKSTVSVDNQALQPLAQDPWASQRSEQKPVIDFDSSHLAYAIFTSGTTGEPKGVLMQHQAVVNTLDWVNKTFAVGSDDHLLFVNALGFDLSVYDIFGLLGAGGKLTIASAEQCKDPALLAQRLLNENFTFWNSSPAYMSQIMHSLEILHDHDESKISGDGTSLRLAFFSGDWIGLLLPQQMKDTFSEVSVISLGGATEAAIWSNYYPIQRIDLTWASIPYGKPIQNSRYYIVDQHLNLCPPGVRGDLVIAGDGLSCGYLNDAPLTAAKFIANPFEPGQLMYRTGDQARWMADGNIEFLGRDDQQVKIRGFRIELGEVEAAFLSHRQISNCAVVVLDDPKRLVAYVINEGQALASDVLRIHVRHLLPDYMVPSIIMAIEQLPLTANGKLDRKALPAPSSFEQLDGGYMAPEGHFETTLCTIWQQLLKLERVGVKDNFFSIGGDSILAIQLVCRARAEGIQLTTQHIFEYQCIHELALFAAEKAVTKVRAKVSGEQRLLPIQQQFLALNPTHVDHYNQSLLLTVPTDLDNEGLMAALQKIVAALIVRHDVLRLRFSDDAGHWQAHYQDYQPQMATDVLHHQTIDSGTFEQQQAQMSEYCQQVQQSLSLTQGKVMAAVLFTQGRDFRRLLLVFHHMVIDGVSWRILLNDIDMAYRQLSTGLSVEQSIALAAKTESFQQWAEFLQDYAHQGITESERQFWLQQFEPVTNALIEPLVGHQAASPSLYESTRFSEIVLNPQLTEALLSDCHHAYHSQINDLLLSGLLLGLSRFSDNTSFRLAIESHGREALGQSEDISETLGWFTTLYPLAFTHLPVQRIDNLIIAVKETLRSVPHNGIGYGLLPAMPQVLPLEQQFAPQILFNFLGQLDGLLQDTPWQQAPESAGQTIGGQTVRQHALSFNGYIKSGQLTLVLDYCEDEFSQSSIAQLNQLIETGLQQVIEHCLSCQHSRFTPSDFAPAKVSADELALISQQYPQLQQIYPPTSSQKGMVFHSQLNAADYLSQFSFNLGGQLNIEMFKAAWQAVINRHEALRSQFVGESLLQVVVQTAQLPCQTFDWTNLTEQQLAQQQQQQLAIGKTQGIDPAQAPLIRLSVAKINAVKHWLLFSFHHGALDGWSVPLVFAEVIECYQRLMADKPAILPAPVSLKNYHLWLAQQDWDQGLSYWSQLLENVTEATVVAVKPPSALPQQEHKQEPQSVTITKHCQAQWDDEQFTLLKDFAKGLSISPNILIQGAWAYLLSRYCDQQQIVFGNSVSGRQGNVHGMDKMIGMFINVVPMVVDFSAKNRQQPLSRWLKQLHQQSIAHSQYDFIGLAQILKPLQWHGSEPLFDTLLGFENFPVAQSGDGPFSVSDFKATDQTNYGLTLLAVPGEQLTFDLFYQSALFSEAMAEQILQHLQVILTGMMDEQVSHVGQLPLLTPVEQALLSGTSRNTSIELSPVEPKPLHQQFEQQVMATPHALACRCEHTSLSYEQLNQRVNRLAHYLIEQDIEAGMAVGIALNRSSEMLVAILAVLKVGACYVPLEPSLPQSRLAHMIDDAQIEMLLLGTAQLAHIPLQQQDFFLLDSEPMDEHWLAEYSSSNLSLSCLAEALAYIIYTSGSTGKPKGVQITQANLSSYLNHAVKHYGDAKTGIVSSSLSFDATITSLFTPLVTGGCARLLRQDGSELEQLATILKVSEQPCLFKLTPSHLRALEPLLDNGVIKESARQMPHLLVIGGEALSGEVIEQWQNQLLPNAIFINEYGPTEATVGCVIEVIKAADLVTTEQVAIGKAIENVCLQVLNQAQLPVPVGVIGQLYIGGPGVAQGYLNNPQLNQQKFITDSAGKRHYQSGDLVHWLADGRLAYDGRIDEQVKIRGFRVELGEISACLRMHDSVSDATVLLTGEPQQLVAYVVPSDRQGDSTIDSSQLADDLAKALPAYMLPDIYLELAQLPLTVNGKVDHTALPAVDLAGRLAQSAVIATTERQKQLCHLWQLVLGLDTVGIEDNFFSIGGDSIRAISLVAKAAAVDLSFSVKDLYQYNTIARLAEAIDAQQTKAVVLPQLAPFALLANEQSLAGHDRSQIEDAYPLSMLQHGMVFHNLIDSQSGSYHDVNSYKISTVWQYDIFAQALTQLVNNHQALRSLFVLEGEQPAQLIFRHVVLPLSEDDIRDLNLADQQAHVRDWIDKEGHAPFDFAAPLWRIVVHCLSADTFYYHLSFHHALLDGWSVASFNTELFATYRVLLAGEVLDPSEFDAPLSYNQFIAMEQQALRQKDNAQYWQDLLQDAPLPWWANAKRGNSRVFRHEFCAVDSQALLQLAPNLAVKERSILLSVHMVLMALLSGHKEVVTSVVNNGRIEAPGGERTLGVFLNALPMRLTFGQQWTWRDIIMAVDQASTQLAEQRHYPLSEIQRLSGMDFSASLFDYVDFHVYQKIEQNVSLLETQVFERTNYQLDINFAKDSHRDLLSAHILLDGGAFDDEFYQRISGYLNHIVTVMLADLTVPLDLQALIGPGEQHQLLEQYNQTQADYAQQDCIHQLFERQVLLEPDAIALQWGDEQLSYQSLNQRANRLAHHLIAQGVKPETLVAVYCHRSIEMAVALLAILKAGGAYVPFDPATPEKRLQSIIDDAGIRFMLSQQDLLANGQLQLNNTIALDQLELSPEMDESNPQPATLGLTSRHLAYVLFTSGSTGQPKGVMVEHQGLVIMYQGWESAYQLEGHQLKRNHYRWLQMANVTFDVFSGDWMRAWCAGGTLVLCPRDVILEPEKLLEIIIEQRIDCAEFVPAVMRLLMDHLEHTGQTLSQMALTLVSSDAWSLADHHRLERLCGAQTRVVNSYGTTEGVIDTSYFITDTLITDPLAKSTTKAEHTEIEGGFIGTPFNNTTVYIVNDDNQLVPRGVIGELCTGGPSLFRGYLNNPEKTAEQLVELSGVVGKVYKTGDLAYQLPGGAVVLQGRKDFQVKLRGLRVELGEIERCLVSHQSIKEAVVVVCDAPQRLVACVVVREMSSDLQQELRTLLADNLPDYMIPAGYVVIDTLPLTGNGKIDRKALIALAGTDEPASVAQLAPQTDTEQAIYQIWQTLLGEGAIGIDDHFFEVGGHSLLGIRLVGALKQQFNCAYGLKDIFEFTTIKQLAAHTDFMLALQAADNVDDPDHQEEMEW